MTPEILYEDNEIIVCYKPAGIATQTAQLSSQDMVSLLKNHLAKLRKEDRPYIGVIHRLDMPVSGLLVFAKNSKAAANLSKQIQNGNANKDYIALCHGRLKEKKGTLVHYLRKDSQRKMAEVLEEEDFLKKQATQKEEAVCYKKAVLTYEVEKEDVEASIVKVHLQTGRFHQIRAQLSAIGHPLLGDMKYKTKDSESVSGEKKIDKPALCAYRLILKHPLTGKRMEFTLEEKYLPDWYLT